MPYLGQADLLQLCSMHLTVEHIRQYNVKSVVCVFSVYNRISIITQNTHLAAAKITETKAGDIFYTQIVSLTSEHFILSDVCHGA